MGENEGNAVGNAEYDGRRVGIWVGDLVGVVAEEEIMMDGPMGGPLIVGAKGANVCSESVGPGVVEVDEVDGGIGWAMTMTNSTGWLRLRWVTAMTKRMITVAAVRRSNWLSGDLTQHDDWRRHRRRSIISMKMLKATMNRWRSIDGTVSLC